MDLILDILIPKEKISRLNMKEEMVEWGGESFSQNPKKYIYKSSIIFEEYKNAMYYERIVKRDLQKYNFASLTLQGQSLTDLEFSVNSEGGDKQDGRELIDLFEELYMLVDIFCIILLLDEEQIDRRYMIDGAQQAIDIFIKSLKWESPAGIIICKGFRCD